MKKLKGLLLLIGLLVVVGSILSCDMEVISLGKALKQCLLGMTMVTLSSL